MIKKIVSMGIAIALMSYGSLAMAAEFSDVSASYWAYKPIKALTNDKIITGYPDNTFKPENKVTRKEFSTMLVKALNQQSMEVSGTLPYKDINEEMYCYGDINRINNLDLVVGYPDNTFKPENNITKTEAMIVLANTLSGKNLDAAEAEKVLSQFIDGNCVREWAKGTVTKSVKNDIYVKYPNPQKLIPNNAATRAEIAELLYKLRMSGALLAQYKSSNIVNVALKSPEVAAVQHLPLISTATSNEVLIKRLTANITGGNVIQMAFVSNFSSKNTSVGAPVELVLKHDLYTQEKTFLIPAGSIFKGQVSEYVKPKLFNRNAKVGFDLNKLVLPSGKTYKISADIASKSNLIGSGYNLQNFKRDAIVTVATTAIGTGIGALAGIPHHSGKGAGIGAYSSVGAGVLAAAIIPGVDINFKSGDKVYIKLLKDIEIDR